MRSTRRRETILKGSRPRLVRAFLYLSIYLSIIGSRLDRFPYAKPSCLLNSEVKNEMKNLTKSN